MKKILLLLVGIFSIVAVRAQMPHPDVLSDMIIKTLETRDWFSNYKFYTICFKYDGIEYPAEELDADITNRLMRQLNKKSPNYRFRYAAPHRHELESIRKYTKRNRFKLPCSVMYIWIELSDSHEIHIFAEPRRLNPAWKRVTFMLSDGVSFTWDYNPTHSRYEIVNTANKRNWNDTTKYRFESTNLQKFDIHKAQQPARVDNFIDIIGYINKTECQCNIVRSTDVENIAEAKYTKINLEKFGGLYAHTIDESGVINYDCDTLYISDDRWTYVSSKYKFKCNKGLYDVNDKGLTPCDYSFLYSSEVLFESWKDNPKKYEEQREMYDYYPFSYEYEMAPYTLWDNKRLIRNMWEVTDWSQNLIRIIIRDHEIVYFDAWSW